VLNLKSNKIIEINLGYMNPAPFDIKIEKLNLAANQIAIKSKIDVKEAVDQLQIFKILKILNLEQNRISDYNMQLFQNTLPSTVEFFNNVQVKGKKDKNAEIKEPKKEQNIEFNEDDF